MTIYEEYLFYQEKYEKKYGKNKTFVLMQIGSFHEAYATTTLRGKGGIQTKVKPLGSAGTADPLDQYGTIGWKAITGCAILITRK